VPLPSSRPVNDESIEGVGDGHNEHGEHNEHDERGEHEEQDAQDAQDAHGEHDQTAGFSDERGEPTGSSNRESDQPTPSADDDVAESHASIGQAEDTGANDQAAGTTDQDDSQGTFTSRKTLRNGKKMALVTMIVAVTMVTLAIYATLSWRRRQFRAFAAPDDLTKPLKQSLLSDIGDWADDENDIEVFKKKGESTPLLEEYEIHPHIHFV